MSLLPSGLSAFYCFRGVALITMEVTSMRMKTKDDAEVSEESLSSYLQNLMSETNKSLFGKNQPTNKKTPHKNNDFLGSPVVKTPSFKCRECGFDPWSRS